MNQSLNTTTGDDVVTELNALLTKQKKSFQHNLVPSAEERIKRLIRLKHVLADNQEQICEAISQDYGNRSVAETKIGELMPCLDQIKYYIKNIPTWMKPSKRHVAALHQPAKAWVEYQPLGVIGIITPWNYPLFLSMGPLICAFAAGNHAMIKISSSSSNFGNLLADILGKEFPAELVSVVNGGGSISDAFSHLAFDKIVFTGSTNIGKTVMRAASENLVPVLLELGGKSPAIVHPSVSLSDVAQRLIMGKYWNSGQTCVAPDYIFLPEGTTKEFLRHMGRLIPQHYPTLANNRDYTSIINQKQYNRIQGYLEDAEKNGATITTINPAREDLTEVRKIAPTFVSNVTEDMHIMQNEIFGPVLPIIEYSDIEDALTFINQRPHPLALYYFDHDKTRSDYIAKRTQSGHFGNNQVVTHVIQDSLPFGGVGASGMGKYHGPEGFFSMSNARSAMSNPRFYSTQLILPPFNKKIHKLISRFLIK